MLQNAYLLAKIGADTAENERKFAEILSKIGNYPILLNWKLPAAVPVSYAATCARAAAQASCCAPAELRFWRSAHQVSNLGTFCRFFTNFFYILQI